MFSKIYLLKINHYTVNHVPPRRAMSTTRSGSLHYANVTINDKSTVLVLKDFLRKCGGRISRKKADLLERFKFVSNGAISIIDHNFAQI